MIADDHQDSVSKATHNHPLMAKHAAGRASFYIRALQVLNKALAGEEIANFEFVLRTRQGQLLEILLNATPRQPTPRCTALACSGRCTLRLSLDGLRQRRIGGWSQAGCQWPDHRRDWCGTRHYREEARGGTVGDAGQNSRHADRHSKRADLRHRQRR